MRTTSTRAIHLASVFIALGFSANYIAPKAIGQETGWVTLFDGKSLDGWDQVGESNWRVEDGAVVVDKMAGKEAGYLVSKNSYKNFVIRVEFWPSDDANSGIYFRCLDPKKITDRTCYEANIFDQRKDPSYGTGAITRYIEVNPMPKAGGKWNTYEVTVNGRTSRWCSTARQRRSCATACSTKVRSRCNTALERSSSAKSKSNRCKAASPRVGVT